MRSCPLALKLPVMLPSVPKFMLIHPPVMSSCVTSAARPGVGVYQSTDATRRAITLPLIVPSGLVVIVCSPVLPKCNCLGNTTTLFSCQLPALGMVAGLPCNRALVHVLKNGHFFVRRPEGSGRDDANRGLKSRIVDVGLRESIDIRTLGGGPAIQAPAGPVGVLAALEIELRICQRRIVRQTTVNPNLIG